MAYPLFERESHTIGDLYDAVFAIHDGAEARSFFEDYVAYTQAHAKDEQYRTLEGAARLAQSNIGWIFGEGMPREDIIMWAEACGAEHPIFGSAILTITPEQAVSTGGTLVKSDSQKPGTV